MLTRENRQGLISMQINIEGWIVLINCAYAISVCERVLFGHLKVAIHYIGRFRNLRQQQRQCCVQIIISAHACLVHIAHQCNLQAKQN